MSALKPSTTVALPPALNALAVVAQSAHDNLVAMEKTKQVYLQHVKESQETITSQAQEILKLKAELASEKQRHAREVTALKAVQRAETARLTSAHATEIANYVDSAKTDQARITALANRVDQEAALVRMHRAMICTYIDRQESLLEIDKKAKSLLG